MGKAWSDQCQLHGENWSKTTTKLVSLRQNRLLISKSFSHFSVTVKKHLLQSCSLLVIFPVRHLRLYFKPFLACLRWTGVDEAADPEVLCDL